MPTGRAALALKSATPPHVLIDAARRFAVFSNSFLAIPAPHVSIAGPVELEDELRVLSLILNSDICTYHQFFASFQWGVDASRSELKALREFPVPISSLSSTVLRDLAAYHRDCVRAEESEKFDSKLRSLANERVCELFKIRPWERWLIEDFVNVHMELNKGKFSPEVARTPTPEERQLYLTSLRECLDGFFAADRGVRHKLEVLVDDESALMAVSLVKSKIAIEPAVIAADDPTSSDLKVIRDRLQTKHSQWVYFDRNLKVYDRKQGVLYQFKPLQRLQWTRRQAVLDADDIIAETLSEGGVS